VTAERRVDDLTLEKQMKRIRGRKAKVKKKEEDFRKTYFRDSEKQNTYWEREGIAGIWVVNPEAEGVDWKRAVRKGKPGDGATVHKKKRRD